MGNPLYQGMALEFLAHSYRITSKFRKAYEASLRAADLFRELGQPALEGQALSTLAHTASTLARNVEAIEAGNLAVQLLNTGGPSPQLAWAYNNLGIALFWNRQFISAQEAFDKSLQICDQCNPPANKFQPLFNRVWAETYRIVIERTETGELPSVEKRREYVEACRPLVEQNELSGLVGGLLVSMHTMWYLCESLQMCWEGQLEASRQVLETAAGWAKRYGTVTWLNALEKWVLVEITDRIEGPRGPKDYVSDMRNVAKLLEHEQLSLLACSIGKYQAQAQGRWEDALAEVRNMAALQQHIKREQRLSAARLREWRSRRALKEAAIAEETGVFEGFIFLNEEELSTQQAKEHVRRQIQLALADASVGNERWPLLEVEVLNLADIESTHSSFMAEEVLRVLAETLCNALAGEALLTHVERGKFVMLFGQSTSVGAATTAMQETQQSLESLDWGQLHPGLSVKLSHRLNKLDGGSARSLGLY